MTARNVQALDAITFQLLAALERYEVSIEQMLAPFGHRHPARACTQLLARKHAA